MSNDDTLSTTATTDENRTRPALVHTTAAVQAFRQSAEHHAATAELRGRETVLRAILPVVDRLERGLDASFLDGIADVAGAGEKLAEALATIGVSRFDVEPGAPFDPLWHDAVEIVTNVDVPQGHVVAQRAPGYMHVGHLLRSALVIVAGRVDDEKEAA